MRGKKRHRKKSAKRAAENLRQTRHYEGGDIIRELMEYQTPPEPFHPHHAAWIAWATGQSPGIELSGERRIYKPEGPTK